VNPQIHGRKRWWRSRLFWLGPPGLLFLLWVWWIFPAKVVTVDAGKLAFDILASRRSFEVTATSRGTRPSDWKVDIYPVEKGFPERVDRNGWWFGWEHKSRKPDTARPLSCEHGGLDTDRGLPAVLPRGCRGLACVAVEEATTGIGGDQMSHGTHGIPGSERRGWWRSRLLWLGVPGLLFLLWVWANSMSHHSEASVRVVGFGRYQGLGLISSPHKMGAWVGRPYVGIFGTPFSGFRFYRSEAKELSRVRDELWNISVEGMDRARFRIVLDARLVVGIYPFIWLGMMWLRHRWKVKAVETPAPTSAISS